MNANWSSVARIGCLSLILLAACNPLQVSPTLPAETLLPPTATQASVHTPATPAATLPAMDSPTPPVTSPPAQGPEMEATQMTPPTPPTPSTGLESLVEQAKGDLAQRLSIEVTEISLVEAREVVWPDASLGCPQPGRVYAQVAVDGLLIRLGVGKEMYFYHSGGGEAAFLCEDTSQAIPRFTPKYDEFVPPPDSKIDEQSN